MIRKTVEGREYESQMVGELHFDQTPKEGSFNPVTSDAVAKIASSVADIDAIVPDDASEENKLATAADVSGVQSNVDTVNGKIPSDTSTTNKLVNESGLQDAIDNASESWSTGFTPKGESSVSDLNDLSTQSNGDSYIVTDSGTLNDGSLSVVDGDQVAWDAANSVWYKLPQYALKQFGTNEIDNLSTTITSFRSGDVIAVDGPSCAAKMSKDTLLTLTSQNALAGNVAKAFDPTRTDENPYKAGESVAYEGKTYTFKVDHYGAWAATDVYERSAESFIRQIHTELDLLKLNKSVGKNLFNKDTLYKKAGFYVAYNDGSFHSQAGFSVYIVPVKGGETISFNQSNNVCALSVIPNLDEYENYQKVIGYISGVSTNVQGWSVPANAVCLLVSVNDSSANACQIEKGSSSTSYESYKEGVNKEDVFGLAAKFAEVESTFDLKLTDKLDKDRSKNLFNKDTSNKKANVYVNYNTGYISSLSGWSAYVVEIPNGVTQVSINQSGAHCCAFSNIPDLTTASGSIPNYLGGVTGASNQGWTLPNGTRSIIVSCQDTLASSTQVESGASSTSYVPYGVGLDWSKILNKPSQERSRILFVGSGLTYTTIQSAVTAAYDGDTIVVTPGTYTESVSNKTKFLNIVGISRDSCILTYPAANYSAPPLDIAKGCVANLTIKTTGQPASGDSGAYGAHIDWDTQIGSSLQFRNCKFSSESRPCVGIGLRSNYTLSFIDCLFENSSGQVPLYAHEQQSNNITGQRLELVNCSFSNKGNNAADAAIMLQETGSLSGNNADLLIQRCIMKRTYGAFTDSNKAVILHIYGGGEPSGNKYLGSSTWSLDYMSELNNEPIANSSEQ